MTARRLQYGFTLVEVVMAIAIMAFLMTAVGLAVRASVDGYSENEKVARAMQGAQVVLERMTRQLRTAQEVDFTQTVEQEQGTNVDVTTLIITAPWDGSGLAQVRYVHRLLAGQTNGKLYYHYQKQGEELVTPSKALLGQEQDLEVNSFDITLITEGDQAKNAKVEMGLTVCRRTFGFSAAVAIRRWQY
ncbi:MAG: type II secretion system protein [Phycisphaerae bacterium]|nr:type II secretion system protein [Phycisphaerae bacterium]